MVELGHPWLTLNSQHKLPSECGCLDFPLGQSCLTIFGLGYWGIREEEKEKRSWRWKVEEATAPSLCELVSWIESSQSICQLGLNVLISLREIKSCTSGKCCNSSPLQAEVIPIFPAERWQLCGWECRRPGATNKTVQKNSWCLGWMVNTFPWDSCGDLRSTSTWGWGKAKLKSRSCF